MQSDIGVQIVQGILFGEDQGQSHTTNRSYISGSFIAGTTLLEQAWEMTFISKMWVLYYLQPDLYLPSAYLAKSGPVICYFRTNNPKQ